MFRNWVVFALSAGAWPSAAAAETQSLFRAETFTASASAALVQRAAPEADDTRQSASLFIGIDGTSFFRPYPVRRRVSDGAVILSASGSQIARLRALISYAESRRDGYDAVQYGARIRPGRVPTELTLAEIEAWIVATPGQPHAIGRYQFIPATLRRVVNHLALPPDTRFSPDVQDRLADVLLSEAGLNAFRDGQISRIAFMNNLAKVWAGFPNSTGKSHYHGFAGNKASMTWAQFDAEMSSIFPDG